MRVAAGTWRLLGARPQRYVDIARPSNNADARVITLSYALYRDFRPQPEGGEGLCLELKRRGLTAQRDGPLLPHGIAIGRLMYIQYTAASAVSPCAKIGSVAHAELVQSFPS